MRNIFFLWIATTASTVFAAPVIEPAGVVLEQTGAQEMTITYKLSGIEPAIVTFDVQTNAGSGVWLSIGRENLRPAGGDVNRLITETGANKTIHWRPTKTWCNHQIPVGDLRVEVKAWSTNAPPDYLLIDLSTRNNVFWYESAAELPFGPVTNDVYKTRMLVMRKILAANVLWRAGTPRSDMQDNNTITQYAVSEAPSPVMLTQDYYIGVYPMTMAQYDHIRYTMGKITDRTNFENKTPRNNIAWETIRGVTDGVKWPLDSVPDANSALGWLRDLAGIPFDMPTEAQWEFACQGGVPTALYSGKPHIEANTKELAWTASELAEGQRVVQDVGQKEPNGYGLYDMLGNCWEWVLDWRDMTARTPQVRIDPRGRASADNSENRRMIRGGSCDWPWEYARAGFRNFGNPQGSNGASPVRGYRLCWTLP